MLSVCLLAVTTGAYADDHPVDCGRRSLRDAVDGVGDKDVTIRFTGVCTGPIIVRTDGLTLEGVGTAIIDGGNQDAVTIKGAGRVVLTHVEVRHGQNGILGVNGAHVSLQDVNSHDNVVSGLALQTASSAALSSVTTHDNGGNGLDLQTGSAVIVTGNFSASNNAGIGISVIGSSITFSQATVLANANGLGIQLAANANAVITDSVTAINADNNLGTGLALASASHWVLSAGTLSTVSDANGITVRGASTLTVMNQARIVSNQNSGLGLMADNGVGVTLVNSTITGNTVKDIQLTFGSRADFQTLVFGTYTCDATVLVRGTSGILCPH